TSAFRWQIATQERITMSTKRGPEVFKDGAKNIKKSVCLLCQGNEVEYSFIAKHTKSGLLCQLLGINKNSYYKFSKTKERKNERTKERKNERTKERKNERTKERKNERTKERTYSKGPLLKNQLVPVIFRIKSL
ncbi:TPA: hypothetical protein ACTXXA_003650, partial [Legionella anisa]